MELHRILVATDFSAAGHAAVARAGQLAAQFQSQLTILHATPDWTLFCDRATAHASHYADITRNAQELLREEVTRLGREFGLTTVRGEINQDRATVAITRALESFQPNLLILGAGGEHIGNTTVLGGTALKLISRVNVPLLLVRDPAPAPYSSTLAAIGDEVGLAGRLVYWAAQFGGSGVCHVVRAYEAPYASRMRLCRYGDAEISQAAAAQRQSAQRDCELLKDRAQAGTQLLVHIVRGAPVSVVLEQIKECAPRLVLIGQHQHHSGEHPSAWAAGVGTRIAYHCPTDVMLVP